MEPYTRLTIVCFQNNFGQLFAFLFLNLIEIHSFNMEVDEQIEIKDDSANDTKINAEKIDKKQPICVIILGMAGSGKSSLCTKLVQHLFGKNRPPYVINCDPACLRVDYPCNIDIRDSIHYKNVMEKYRLGPNGSIITSLNLFVTRFDQVLDLVDKRKESYSYVLLDTPGQVEVFTWSASGSIITEALASKYPTVILFVIDTVRSHNPTTFMSNMLYACSIMYKYKLPIIVALNKTDIIDHQFAMEWMQNSEIFETAINEDPTYMACLNQSLVSALDIFYQDLSVIGISSKTGTGFDQLIDAIDNARIDYEQNYRPELDRQQQPQSSSTSTTMEELEQKTNQISLKDQEQDTGTSNNNKQATTTTGNDDLITFGKRRINMDL
ncbi:GPN-loop GTPase 1 [Dermatophagoides farinae]|uniref:GPN-loop GTPase 1 n=1 Tax=Dermatophagoides farinae TaxID=6954 RepID=UPI003F62775E